MKKLLKKYALLLAATAFIINFASCKSNDDDDDDKKTPEKEQVNSDVTPGTIGEFPASIKSGAELVKTLDSSNQNVILLYYRPDGQYSNWGLWLWPDGGDGAPGWDDTSGKFKKDSSSGIAYMVLDSSLLKTSTAALAAITSSANLNFIIRDPNWAKDPGDDQVMDLASGNKHFMVISGDKNVYSITENMSPSFSSVLMESPTTMKVVLGVKYGLKTSADSNGFSLVSNDGSVIAVKDVVNYANKTDRSKNFTDTVLITLASAVDASKSWSLQHEKFGKISVNTNAAVKESLNDFLYSGSDLGLTLDSNGATFKVWAPTASDVKLLLYASSADVGTFQSATVAAKASGSTTEKELYGKPAVDPVQMTFDKNTGIWTSTQKDFNAYKYYKYQIVNNGTTYYVCDIYAKAASADSIAAQITDINSDSTALYNGTYDSTWGTKEGYYNPFGSTGSETKTYNDAVIYEMHIRDWSRAVVTDSTGKFLDIANSDKIISYIKDLGVTHVQIMPMFDYSQVNADDGYNWGYNPYHYNVPEGRYVSSGYTDGTQAVKELRTMIAKFHEAGIAVNMDVVYNHTSGTAGGSLYDSTVPYYYYRINADGSYSNGSGCGNETDSEAPMFKKYMIDSLKHWMLDYHINGFRFDLMGLHSTETMAAIYKELSAIDKNVMVYGEPWTGGTSLVKNGVNKEKIDSCADTTNSENGVACFNDDIRNAIKGAEFGGFGIGQVQGKFVDTDINAGLRGNAFTSVTGRSLNYVECHDNYTLFDKLDYSLSFDKVEGKDAIVSSFITVDKLTDAQLSLIKSQDKLCAAFVILAQGTPFINGGQEFMRTKRGNPDSYSADTKGGQKWDNGTGEFGIDTVNTVDLSFVEKYNDVYNTYKGLIALRKSSPVFTNATNIKITNPKPGVTRYTVSNASETYRVFFNATDEAHDLSSDTTGYTKVIDVTSGTPTESASLPDSVPAKSFVILKK